MTIHRFEMSGHVGCHSIDQIYVCTKRPKFTIYILMVNMFLHRIHIHLHLHIYIYTYTHILYEYVYIIHTVDAKLHQLIW